MHMYHHRYDWGRPPYQPDWGQPPYGTPYEQFEKPPLSFYYGENEVPYPLPSMKPANGLIAHFQDENGQLDIDKMLSTVGQVANTYQQVYPIFKQIGGLLKFVNQRNS